MSKRLTLLVAYPESTRITKHHGIQIKELGMDVCHANSMEDAIRMMDRPIDVIVSDGGLGFDNMQPSNCLHRAIRVKKQSVPLIVVGDTASMNSDIWGNLRDDPLCTIIYPLSAHTSPSHIAEMVARLSVGA